MIIRQMAKKAAKKAARLKTIAIDAGLQKELRRYAIDHETNLRELTESIIRTWLNRRTARK
jgi:hypothetical protein